MILGVLNMEVDLPAYHVVAADDGSRTHKIN